MPSATEKEKKVLYTGGLKIVYWKFLKDPLTKTVDVFLQPVKKGNVSERLAKCSTSLDGNTLK